MKRIPRPSPGLVIACLALFASLAGVAGALPGKNTVDSGDVKKNSLTGKDIKESTLKLPPAAVAQGLNFSIQTKVLPAIPATGSAFGAGTVNCPAGKEAIAGGGYSDQSDTDSYLGSSFPVKGESGVPQDGESFDGWRIGVVAGSGGSTPQVFAVCVG